MFLAWTGVGWTQAETTGEGCPFKAERTLRWGPLGLGEGRGVGMKGQDSQVKCSSIAWCP